MSRATRLAVALGFAVISAHAAGCDAPAGNASAPASASAPPSAAASASSAPANALPAATSSGLPSPKRLVRKTTPAERFASDQKQCDSGDKAACRRVAYRFSASELDAGCGVPRGRPAPALKLVPTDIEGDGVAYEAAMKKACALGDDDACALARIARKSFEYGAHFAHYSATRRAPNEIGIWAFRAKVPPPAPPPAMPKRDDAKVIADRRKACLENFDQCSPPDTALFRQEPAPKDGKLSSDLEKLAEDTCAATRDCDDIYVALDKAGYSPEALAPLRAAFAKTLSGACLEGECTCGDATKYLAPADADRLDLGILGCENGEAEGCAVVASAYDTGEGLPKDPDEAFTLYDLACPAIHSSGRDGEYSAHACQHFAELYAGGPYPGKDRDRGTYYAGAACRSPGYEFDHAPCVFLGWLWATKRTVTFSEGMNERYAEAAAYGDVPDFNHECDRPSVAAACKDFREALKTSK